VDYKNIPDRNHVRVICVSTVIKLAKMLRYTHSYLVLILFLLTLSCRSDARNLETANETKKIEATIAYGSLDEALESAEVALSKDPEVSEDKEALVLAVSSATKGSQNEEIIPIPENVGNVVQTKVAPTKTTRIEEIS
jgi:hypothetical protein